MLRRGPGEDLPSSPLSISTSTSFLDFAFPGTIPPTPTTGGSDFSVALTARYVPQDPLSGVGFGIGYGYQQITQSFGPAIYGPPIPVGQQASVGRSVYNPPSREFIPPVRLVDLGPQIEDDPEDPGDDTAPVLVVIPPTYRPTTTVFEDVPGGIYETNRAPTDWARVYEQYVELNQPEIEEVFHDTIDWGGAVGTILGGVLDPFGVGDFARAALSPPTTVTGIPSLGQQTVLRAAPVQPIPGGVAVAGCPPTGPKYAKICIATGEITPLRRRRRRRLLTSSDIKDLSALKSIVGGAALQGAVVQAVRR